MARALSHLVLRVLQQGPSIRRQKVQDSSWGAELSFEAALLVPFNNVALQEDDDHQRQDAAGVPDEQFVQVEHCAYQ